MKKIQEHLGLVFLIIIAIFAVAIGGYFTLRKGVFIGDDFYYKVRADKFVHNTVNYVERTKDDTCGRWKKTECFLYHERGSGHVFICG